MTVPAIAAGFKIREETGFTRFLPDLVICRNLQSRLQSFTHSTALCQPFSRRSRVSASIFGV